MPPSISIPVLVWEDEQGGVTASAVDLDLMECEAVAFDGACAGALRQLKGYLQWRARAAGGRVASEFVDVKLTYVRVALRPEYRSDDDERRFACERSIELRLPCVHGTSTGGLICCSLPTLGAGFYCHEAAALRPMVVEYVRQRLGGLTPRELSRYLPPRTAELDRITVKTPSAQRGQGRQPPALTALQAVADAMGMAEFRKAYSAAFQREQEMAQLRERLTTGTGSLLLAGEEGAGKTTLLVNAVRSIEREAQGGAGRRFWHTSAARLIAGMSYLGQWQERCETIIDELSSVAGVLCAERMIDLVRQGGCDPAGSIAAFLLPYLQSGQLRLVCEATPAEAEACRYLLPGFVQALEMFRVSPLDHRSARLALEQTAEQAAKDLNVEVAEGVTDAVLRLVRRFTPYQPLPGRAASFLRELLDRAKQRGDPTVSTDQAITRFTAETGLPEQLLDDDLPLSYESVFDHFQHQVIGQPDACRAAAQIVCTFKAGLNDPQRPIATMLFCGPTGVGKTQLAKTLAEFLFGAADESDRLVRLDMSEYALPWAAERLITKPDGGPSEFINRMRARPFAVVLLDEIEKASSQVFDVLLGLLDEGRLTDRLGRTTWFRAAVVVMTSNLGGGGGCSVGFADEPADSYEKEVRSFFRPEFFNRIDALVTFQPLGREACRSIVRKELADLQRREGVVRRNVKLTFTDAVVNQMVEAGFDPRYGARPLQRAIQSRVAAQISRFLVEHPELRHANLAVNIDALTNAPTILLC